MTVSFILWLAVGHHKIISSLRVSANEEHRSKWADYEEEWNWKSSPGSPIPPIGSEVPDWRRESSPAPSGASWTAKHSGK